jgi:hypothetical protein
MCAAPKGNKYALGNKGGQPPYYPDPAVMEEVINDYFNECIRNKENPKITGLVLFLGFCDLSSFYDYEKKEVFSHIVKRAKTCVAFSYESLLTTSAVGGAVFALKNMGWKDKTEVESNNKHHHTGLTMIFQQSPGCEPLKPLEDDQQGS